MSQHPNETLDDLTIGGLKILQAKNGYRFSIDPVLLNGFIPNVKDARVVDLGTGNGIIPLLLSARDEALSITGVEIQPEMADRGRRTIELNDLNSLFKIVQGDIRGLPFDGLEAESVDVVTTNPPYRKLDTGRVAPGDERGMARHELAGALDDFLRAAALLLKNSGKLYIIYIAERLPELLNEMRSFRLEPKRMRLVHSRQNEDASLVLVEGRKNGKPGMKVEPPLVVYKGEGRVYTDEVLAFYGKPGRGTRKA